MSVSEKHILIIEDDPEMAGMLAMNLNNAGFEVSRAVDGLDALEKARAMEPSMIVLDLLIPKMSGTEVLRALKSDPRTSQTPVIVLTACKEELDRIVCLELGADDYMTKPFSSRELVLRIKSILSRRTVPKTPTKQATVGEIHLDHERHEVRVKNKQVDLTAVEFRLLSELFRIPGKVFSREELLDGVWGADSEIEIRTVDTHLRRLREKLGPAAVQIMTVRGFGYRLDEK